MSPPKAKPSSARARVLDVLHDLQWHAAPELAAVGGNRYVARIHELRRLGYDIRRGAGRYRLVKRARGPRREKLVKVYLREGEAERLTFGVVEPGTAISARIALATFRANRGRL